MRGAFVFTALMMPLAAFAQQGPMPAETLSPDGYVAALGGDRIRMLYNGIGQDFLFELQDRDVQNLFSYGMPPADRTVFGSDMVVVLQENWEDAALFWNAVGLGAVAVALEPYAGQGDAAPAVVLSEVTSPEGHTIRIYTFVKTVQNETQNERCMARKVIDDTYLGPNVSAFNAFTCSQSLRP